MSTFFLKIYHDFFQIFLSFLFSVLRVSSKIHLNYRDWSVSTPAESVAETATLNYGMCHDEDAVSKMWERHVRVILIFLYLEIISFSIISCFFFSNVKYEPKSLKIMMYVVCVRIWVGRGEAEEEEKKNGAIKIKQKY